MNKATIINVLRALVMYPVWSIFMPLFTLLAYPLTFLPQSIRYDNRVYFFITSMISRSFVWPTFLKIQYRGLENLPHYPTQPAIIVANHTSAIDIPLIDMLIGTYPHVWMSKELYGKIPLFGRLVRVMHILVHRHNPRKAIQALINALARVQGHARHLIIFPEGTRHADGTLGEFKEGFAIAAEKLQRPIIPIAINNLHKALPKGSIICHSVNNPISVHIGTPMFMHAEESRQDFIQRVHTWFQVTLDNSRTSR